MLNKYIYKRFKLYVSISKLAFIDMCNVSVNDGRSIQVVIYSDSKRKPTCVVADGIFKINFCHGADSRIYFAKGVLGTMIPNVLYAPDSSGNYMPRKVHNVFMISGKIKIHLNNILASCNIYNCLGYYTRDRIHVCGRIMYCIGVDNFDIDLLKNIDKIYILKERISRNEYNIYKIITRTYITYGYKIYDLLTDSKYYLNPRPGAYMNGMNNTDKMMLNGTLEIDEFLPFEYVFRIKIADGRILLREIDHNGSIRLLPS